MKIEDRVKAAAKAVCGAVYTDGIDVDLDWRSRRDRKACEKVARAVILAFQEGATEMTISKSGFETPSDWYDPDKQPPPGTYIVTEKLT